MSTLDLSTRLRVSYEAHIERLIKSLPAHHHEIVRSVLRHSGHVSQVVQLLALKSELTLNDHEYHNAVIGGPTPGALDRFTVFEIGCTSSLEQFESYWRRLGYDSYIEYVAHIPISESKGAGLYEQRTGQTFPADPTDEFINRLIFGHVLRDLESNTILVALQWQLSDGRFVSYPPELVGSDIGSPGAMRIPDVHLPDSPGYPLLVIPRDDIEAANCETLLRQIADCTKRAQSLSGIQGRIGLAVDGYNEDPRELFEVPEVRAYFRELDSRAPHILFFIASEGNGACVRLFLKMFISPEFFLTEDPPDDLKEEFTNFVLTRLNAVADFCAKKNEEDNTGLDPVSTVHQTFRACGYQISRSQAEHVLDSR